MGDGSKGLKSRCRCGGFIIVDAKSLCEALSDVVDFVVDNIASVISLTFADEFST